MAKSTATSTSILALIFNGTTFANIAINATASPLTDLYVGLHTGDPGVGGSQLTNEATFGSYARKAIARTNAGWTTPSGGSTNNAALAQFIEATSGPNVITYVSIGTDATGAGRVLYAGQLSSPRTIDSGIQAQFNANSLVVTES
jgi:hypothetical protein